VSGDLFNAACNADANNARALHLFAIWIAQAWPTDAYGSRDALTAWISDGGLEGHLG